MPDSQKKSARAPEAFTPLTADGLAATLLYSTFGRCAYAGLKVLVMGPSVLGVAGHNDPC